MLSVSSTKVRCILSLLLALSVFFCTLPVRLSAAPEPGEAEAPSKLEEQVKQWVSVLAQQKLFSDWQGADPQIQALGPGTHGWLVLFSKEGRHIGYMVVHAVTDGSFRMGEYGVGPFTLFSQQQLTRSLIQNGLITGKSDESFTAVKHYIHPFAAAWEVKIDGKSYWLDAKTAELLPLKEADWNEIAKVPYLWTSEPLLLISKGSSMRLNPSFDAYERLPWLAKEAPFARKDAEKILLRLNKKLHLRYVTEPFGEAMLYAAPVTGYQRWPGGRLDLALDMEGTRFIPIEMLTRCGQFYR
jgi:hypothetical protein